VRPRVNTTQRKMKANNKKTKIRKEKTYANRTHGNELLQISSHIRTQSKTMKPINVNWAPDKFEKNGWTLVWTGLRFFLMQCTGTDTDFLGFLFLFFCIENFAGAPCSREKFVDLPNFAMSRRSCCWWLCPSEGFLTA
jgi:hypothetical protein